MLRSIGKQSGKSAESVAIWISLRKKQEVFLKSLPSRKKQNSAGDEYLQIISNLYGQFKVGVYFRDICVADLPTVCMEPCSINKKFVGQSGDRTF